jgi:hypothetical protein
MARLSPNSWLGGPTRYGGTDTRPALALLPPHQSRLPCRFHPCCATLEVGLIRMPSPGCAQHAWLVLQHMPAAPRSFGLWRRTQLFATWHSSSSLPACSRPLNVRLGRGVGLSFFHSSFLSFLYLAQQQLGPRRQLLTQRLYTRALEGLTKRGRGKRIKGGAKLGSRRAGQ